MTTACFVPVSGHTLTWNHSVAEWVSSLSRYMMFFTAIRPAFIGSHIQHKVCPGNSWGAVSSRAMWAVTIVCYGKAGIWSAHAWHIHWLVALHRRHNELQSSTLPSTSLTRRQSKGPTPTQCYIPIVHAHHPTLIVTTDAYEHVFVLSMYQDVHHQRWMQNTLDELHIMAVFATNCRWHYHLVMVSTFSSYCRLSQSWAWIPFLEI